MRPQILTLDDIDKRFIKNRWLQGTWRTASTLAEDFIKYGYASRLESGALEFKYMPTPKEVNRIYQTNAVLKPLNHGSSGVLNRLISTRVRTYIFYALLVSIFTVGEFYIWERGGRRVYNTVKHNFYNAIRKGVY